MLILPDSIDILINKLLKHVTLNNEFLTDTLNKKSDYDLKKVIIFPLYLYFVPHEYILSMDIGCYVELFLYQEILLTYIFVVHLLTFLLPYSIDISINTLIKLIT